MLPPLPVPDLSNTCGRLLKSLRPLARSEEEYLEAEAMIEDFQRTRGPCLQKQLVERSNTRSNWLEAWWELHGYLLARYPIAVNVNYFSILTRQDDYHPVFANQLDTATLLTYATLLVKKSVYDETITADVGPGDRPLCTKNYMRMYGCSRIPGESCDHLQICEDSRHIAVFYRNIYYKVVVYEPLDGTNDTNGDYSQDGDSEGDEEAAELDTMTLLPIRTIRQQLQSILDGTLDQEDSHMDQCDRLCVPVLTTSDRTQWAQNRESLIASHPQHSALLEMVEKAIFCLVLDERSPANPMEVATFSWKSPYVWYDKSWNVIVYANGCSGNNVEHTFADAMIPTRLTTEMMNLLYQLKETKEWLERDAERDLANDESQLPASLQAVPFVCSVQQWPEGSQLVRDAARSFSSLISSVEMLMFEMPNITIHRMKALKLSPDSLIQIALQLAYYRVFSHCTATYETAMTRMFEGGRTDTCRSCTGEVMRFIRAYENGEIVRQSRGVVTLLHEAVRAHRQLMSEAVAGQGIDRHLLGLRIVDEGRHPLWELPLFQRSSHWQLSTSNVGPGDWWGGYAPGYPGAVGFCYGVSHHSLHGSCSTWKSSTHVSPNVMIAQFKSSLEELVTLIEHSLHKSHL